MGSVAMGLSVIFVALLLVGASAQCEFSAIERKDCGFNGIDQGSCEAKGCCWGPVGADQAGVPWCFLKSSPAPTQPGNKCVGDTMDWNKRNTTLTCSGAKPDCCVTQIDVGILGPPTCYNKASEVCCGDWYGRNYFCPIGKKCVTNGARAGASVSCCAADTTPCNAYTWPTQGICIKAGQKCCRSPMHGRSELGTAVASCPVDSVCCSPKYAGHEGPFGVTPTKCCPAGSTCCSSSGASSCCAPGEKCVAETKYPNAWFPNSTKCVSTLPTFMAVV